MDELLTCHISTKERADHYAEFFEKLIAIAGTPSLVLELACGLNPIAWYRHSNIRPVTHIVSDISDVDCAQLQHWFEINDLSAKAVPLDLVKHAVQLSDSPFNQRFDMCIMLKTLDTLEYQKRYVTYDLLKRINARWIVASFPLQSVRRVQMDRSSKINWFEKMLARCEMTFVTFEIPGEVVYVCQRADS
jgi:16S rRNA (guanine(1405)-N(7))-methyltransferase